MLLVETEWSWTQFQADAYIFPTFEAADAHVAILRGQGESHIHAAVVDESERRVRLNRLSADRSTETEQSITDLMPPPPRLPKTIQERTAIAKRGARTRYSRGRVVSQDQYIADLEKKHLF